MLDGRDVTEEVTAADKEKYPHYGTDDIVMSKGQVVHFADAGNEGCKGTHNRHKAGQENRFMTMLVIKCAGLVDMLLFNDVLLLLPLLILKMGSFLFMYFLNFLLYYHLCLV